MEDFKIKLQGEDYTIAPPSLDKTMRITDFVSEILEKVPGIFDDAEQFKQEYRLNHREILTKEEASDPEYADVLEALNLSLSDFDNPENIVTDEITNKSGIAFYRSPSEMETIAHIFPKVWEAARPNIIQLAAIIIIKDKQLEEHDRKGAVNGLIEEKSHWIKYNLSLEEVLEIISVGAVIVKNQIESASKSLGKLSENLMEMLGEAQTEEPASEQASSTTEKSAEQI